MTGLGSHSGAEESISGDVPSDGGTWDNNLDSHIIQAMPQAMILVDKDNRIKRVNGAAEILFDSGAPHLCQQLLNNILPFASPILALVEQVRRSGATVNEYSIEIGTPSVRRNLAERTRSSDGQLVDISGAPVGDGPGQVLLVLQKRTMPQMIERQLSHQASARSVSSLAMILAHEIKNPLSGIKGAAQLLESGLDDNDRALTQLICDETDRICQLVDRMDVFADRGAIPMTAVNIHSVLNHVKQIAENGFAKQVTFREHYDPSLPEARGDRDLLIQAILNLVKNAAEAVGGRDVDGCIRLITGFRPGVRLSIPGRSSRTALPLMIEIEDNGPGIAEDLLPRLFDPFVSSKRRSSPSGTGLGLAMVAKIIGDHGGIVECDLTRGVTVFRILLPMFEPMDEFGVRADSDGDRHG